MIRGGELFREVQRAEFGREIKLVRQTAVD